MASLLHCFKQKKTINVRTNSDMYNCGVTGCAVISADRLLLADYNNNKLMIVNTDTCSVVEEMTVDDRPYDVTVLPGDQVAVTLPDAQRILILGTVEKLTRIKNIYVGKQGLGIDYYQNCLYVVCQKPNSLLVLDILRKVQRYFRLQTAQTQFNLPSNIAVSNDGQKLYISDKGSRFVASLTLEGYVDGEYKHNELEDPRGLVVLEDGSLLVCCYSLGTIHHITADLNQGRTIIKDVTHAESICCHPGNRQIYLGALFEDILYIIDYE